MATITLNKSQSSGKYIQGKIEYSSTQTTSSNKSSVTATLYVRKGDTTQTLTIPTGGTWSYSLSIAGTNVSGSIRTDVLESWVKIASKTVTDIDHNGDGTKTITISGSVTAPSGTSFSGHKSSGSSNVSLPTIPRASSITSASNITLGNACNIKWTPASSNFAYKLKFTSGSVSYTTDMITPKQTSSYTYDDYTMSVSKWASAMPSSYSATCTATLYTYSSSSATSPIGSASKTFTLTLSSSVKPTISSFTVTPSGDFNGYYVQGKSKCSLSIQFSAGTGSSMNAYSITGHNISQSGTSSSATSLSGKTDVLTKSGTITYTATVSDKRTASNPISATKSIYVYPYASPTVSITAARTATSGEVKITYKAKYSSINSQNKLGALNIYSKLSTESTWSKKKTVTLGTTTSGSITLTGFNGQYSYDFYATVADTAYGSSSKSESVSVPSEFRLVNINFDDNGVAFGKMAEGNSFDCNLDAEFYKGVTVPNSGGPVINGYSVGTLGPGESIASGDDLNDYTTAGVFKSTGATISETLANTPHKTSGFKLIVECLGDEKYFRQVVIPRLGSCQYYVRYYNNGSWYGWQTFSAADTTNYLPLSGGNLTGKLTLDGNLYYTDGNAGIDCKNSDIINANAIYFMDESDSAGEAINFYRSTTAWDTLYAVGGKLKFHPNRTTSTALGGYTVYNSSNFRRGTCTLSSSNETTVSFSSALGGAPTVMLTPLTDASGVIPGKVRSTSSTGFTAIIGGSAVSSAKFAYLAIYY